MAKKFCILPAFYKRLFLSGFVFVLITSFYSCKIYQPSYYFKDVNKDTLVSGFTKEMGELPIENNDELAIVVSSLNPQLDINYNSPSNSSTAAAASEAMNPVGYHVNENGNIYMHQLGEVKVSGLTRSMLKAKLEKDLQPFLKDVIVSVTFANHRISVFGETTSQVIEMPSEKMPLLEVLAKTNAATSNSKLNSVMVIRENGNSKEFKNLNLENYSIVNSSWYFLQPNDIIIVKPNVEKVLAEQKRIRNQTFFTLALSSISLLIIIIDRVFK